MSRGKNFLRDNENLVKEIRRAMLDISTAENFFEVVSEPKLVDIAIYDLEAKRTKYSYLIKIAKEKGVKNCWAETLS